MGNVDGVFTYCWLSTNGALYFEDQGSDCTDGGEWVTKRAITSWIHIAGLQGEQFLDQVLLLAKRVSDHDLTIAIAFDYVDSYASSRTFTAATIASQARQWLVKEVGQTTSQAIRVKIEDATPSSGDVGLGEGGTWIGLTISGQPHQGAKRSSAINRGGT